MRPRPLLCSATLISLMACADNPNAPTGTTVPTSHAVVGGAADLAVGSTKPNFNLEVILRAAGDGDGFGHVTFRQDNDDAQIIDLGVWVRDLAPNHGYRLQRATDATLDDNCIGTNWLTLGRGTTPEAIVTDSKGTGQADLFRDLSGLPRGSAFDIRFRVVDASTAAVVLTSECYQFFVR